MPVTPRMYQKLSARIAGKPEERILSYLMLRSLKQARYSEVNEGPLCPGCAQLHALHLADPALPGPDRAPHYQNAAARRRSGKGTLPRTGIARPGRTRMRARERNSAFAILRSAKRRGHSAICSHRGNHPSRKRNWLRLRRKPASPSAAPLMPSANWSSGRRSASCRTASAKNSRRWFSIPPSTACLSS
jgi:hypothetical protein